MAALVDAVPGAATATAIALSVPVASGRSPVVGGVSNLRCRHAGGEAEERYAQPPQESITPERNSGQMVIIKIYQVTHVNRHHLPP